MGDLPILLRVSQRNKVHRIWFMGCGGLKDANNAELAGREEFQ
jgi:hypothetical protein